jgi:hypothetical protein
VEGHRQEGGRTRTLTRRFTVAALVTGAILTSSLAVGPTPAAAGDGSVRVLSAGPVQLAPGGSALARLWLPAVQGGATRLTYLGDGGQILGQVDVEAPPKAGALFEVVVEATYDGKVMSISDGTSNTIMFQSAQGIIAILIGLRAPAPQGQPAMLRKPMATLQVLAAPGQFVHLLPFIEQEN